MSQRILSLRCRACGATAPIEPAHACDRCFGPLEVAYDYAEIDRRVSRASIAAGPPSIWRYRDLLPLDDGLEPISLGEGLTPLIHARNLGERLGLSNLYLKNDTQNPTGSFKDRVVSVAASWARAHGFATLACASTGNLANAVAAYAAHAGMRAVTVIPDGLEAAKVATTAVFGPTLVRVIGTYDDANRLGSELADEVAWAFCNINVRPYYSEGSKTLTYETVEQLGWRLPDEILIPIASGSQFVKADKAIRELVDLGLVGGPAHTRLTGAQAAGCAPVADAFAGGGPVRPVRTPDTVARSLAIGNPSDGEDVLRAARRTGGVVESVGDEEILDSVELLARTEGIFAETAGGVVVGVLRRLAAAGRWRGDEVVVAYITGHGLKTAEALDGRTHLDEPIPPSLRAFAERFGLDGAPAAGAAPSTTSGAVGEPAILGGARRG
jgi:threonine synthase